MKRLPCFAAVLSLGLLYAWFPATLNAAFVDGGVVSGPGGSGNANAFTGSTLAEPLLLYTSINYLDLSLTVDSAATYDISEAPAFGRVSNLTGTAWSGFTWELISGPPSSFIYSPGSPIFSGHDFSGTFTDATGTATFATFAGGTLPDNVAFQPNFDILVSAPGTFVIRETPIPVPEPSGLVLLAIGAVAAVGYRRLVRK